MEDIEAGTYQIELDQLKETVIIRNNKQTEGSAMSLIRDGRSIKEYDQKITYIFVVCSLILASCEDYYDTKNNPVTYGDTYLNIGIATDKAVYKPGRQSISP